MRSTILPTTLLLLLTSSLSNAAPLPDSDVQSPPDCAYKTCLPRLQLVGVDSHNQPPPSRPLDIVQIEVEITERLRQFDNSIFTPSSHTPPSKALDVKRPLSSSYLQSLSHAAQSLEDKVSSYLRTHPSTPPSAATQSKVTKPCNRESHIYLPGNVYITTHQYISRKPDVVVVGIVLLFLTMLVLAEFVDRFVTAVKERRARRQGRGEIYLEEKDGEIKIIGEGISIVAWEDEKSPQVYEIEV